MWALPLCSCSYTRLKETKLAIEVPYAHCVVAAGREDAKLQSNYSDSHVAVSVADNIIYIYIHIYILMYVFMHVLKFLKEPYAATAKRLRSGNPFCLALKCDSCRVDVHPNNSKTIQIIKLYTTYLNRIQVSCVSYYDLNRFIIPLFRFSISILDFGVVADLELKPLT